MIDRYWILLAGLAVFPLGEVGHAKAQNPSRPGCSAVDNHFVDEVWAKVGERICLRCHQAKGKASDTRFLLRETTRMRSNLLHNRQAFARMALAQEKGKSRLLVKVIGGLDHGGGAVVQSGSTSYHILERFVRQLKQRSSKTSKGTPALRHDSPAYFKGVQMITPERLLRRVTLSLGARLPSQQERAAVQKHGLKAMDGILDQLMKEDAFYQRLKEGFNDIFLTQGYTGIGEEVLSYNHFEKTRLWYQKHDLSHISDKKERQRARWHLANVYRDALRREPMEMIEHIVRNNKPFTEIVTANYIMVSPYTARGYGVFKQLRSRFKNSDDPFEYVPVKLKALRARNGKVQESATGFYPHAGLLSMFHYLRRYPTTETNRNRLRARMYYQHFLGIDVMALAPRVTDAAATTARYKIPTMQAPDCVVCHKTIDPLAGLFQDYNEEGHLGPRKDGWYTDMFGPGWEGEALPKGQRWRALQWLGERTARDPRFATAMVEHVYHILMGRKVLRAPEDIEDPLYEARRRAYSEQRKLISEVAERFVKARFDLKAIFKALVLSEFYRADGLAMLIKEPCRQAELDDVGLVHLLTPEQLERKIEAVFGQKWGRLNDKRFKILYGGIDSQSVTERMTQPSGAMGSIQRILSNEVACKHVALDFTRKPEQRRLFPNIELDVVPGADARSNLQIRKAIVHLHQHILGRHHTIDHPEVQRTYRLFAGIVSTAKATRGVEKRGSYFCGRVKQPTGKYHRLDDPHYTLRAWRAVVTYLLRQHDFLYE